MSAQPCLSQDILEINRNKEYTLISTELLENVLTDTQLNAQTSKLWQILFNKARYNSNLEIKISYSYLAKKLNKSTRTIARYVGSLQDAGYLIIQHNFDKNGGQRPSTISVRVPTAFIEHIKSKKDRVNKKNSFSHETLVIEGGSQQTTDPITTNTQKPDSFVLCETIIKSSSGQVNAPEHNHSDECVNVIDLMNEYYSPSLQESIPEALNEPDKIDMGGYDINVIQKDTNKKEINNNNNVVPIFHDNKQIIDLQNEIDSLEKQLIKENKKLTNIKDHTLLYEQIRENSQIEATLFLRKNFLERIKNEINDKIKKAQYCNNLNNPRFMVDKKGDRILPLFTFKRLVNSLKSYGYSDNSLHILINEIIFEARFGSLINCNKTNKPLSVDNAINVALKLVREKRWSTPKLLKM